MVLTALFVSTVLRIDYAAGERGADAELGGRSPFAHALRTPSFREWTRLDFVNFRRERPRAHSPLRIVARRTIGGFKAPRVDFAEAGRCPGLAEAVVEMEGLQAPAIDVPGLGRFEPTSNADGTVNVVVRGDRTSYRVWSRITGFTHAPDEPGGAWMEKVLSVAAPCWRAEPPGR